MPKSDLISGHFTYQDYLKNDYCYFQNQNQKMRKKPLQKRK